MDQVEPPDGDTDLQPEHRGGIRDVARQAGVSIATVSRTFNRPHTVSEATRDRVLSAARLLYYIPDSAARALSSQRSQRIGALIPTVDDAIFARFVASLQRCLGDAGFGLVVGIHEFDDIQEQQEVRGLIEGGVDGVILCGERRDPAIYELLKARNLPYVITNIFTPDGPHASVGYDNVEGARAAVAHLLDLGHRQIGVLDYPGNRNDRAVLRKQGVAKAFTERGLDFDDVRHIERPYGIDDGRIGLRTLLDTVPGLTAVFCGNDVLATGVLFEAQSLGLRVPEQLSIVGFDDLELSAHLTPPLTTVRVESDKMGTRAAEMLLHKLEGKPVPHAIKIDANLIVRSSTAPVSAGQS